MNGSRFSVCNYLFKVCNGNIWTICEVCSKLTTKDTRTTSKTELLAKIVNGWIFAKKSHLKCRSSLTELATYFTHFSGLSVTDSEQVNAGWIAVTQWINICLTLTSLLRLLLILNSYQPIFLKFLNSRKIFFMNVKRLSDTFFTPKQDTFLVFSCYLIFGSGKITTLICM